MKSLSWDDFRLVKAIERAQGIAGAAAELHLDQSTIFRRLGALEESLGGPLFERRRSGYRLTPNGEEMAQAAARMEDDALSTERRIRGKAITPRGEIRIATADSLLTHLLTPMFRRFQDLCPDIRLDVVVGNAPLNLSKRDADIAIRATQSPPDTLVGRKVAPINWALYGLAADYPDLDAFPGADSLAEKRWVALGEDMAALRAVRAFVNISPEKIVFRANSVLALAQAVEGGIGVGHLPCFIGDRNPAMRRLSEIRPDMGDDLWLLTHEDLRHSPRIRIFMDFIGEELMKQRAVIAGSG
ncbi:LysR family transcriptional regulator [Rhizobium sp. FKL33]|uniref:LysR family transcriptional regulator n=1 Tax=Rhizobium sp. FKL33 TaxID=2562307 RepID=UPI0010BFE807|nr:LysR family transcriptional regulator [Rhizobium sp. FKL33]